MSDKLIFQELTGWDPTRETLHLYSKAVGVIPRAIAPIRPNWWHISLKVEPDGLVTDQMPLPNGSWFRLRMDLVEHVVQLEADDSRTAVASLKANLTGAEFGNQIVRHLNDMGITGEFETHRFQSSAARYYETEHAERFFSVISRIDAILKKHRNGLTGSVGPVQLWPHGFDLAFEWFGTRRETLLEDGELREFSSQLNLGFSPGSSNGEPYFYSNPWPFEANTLLKKELPTGSRWHTEDWQGTIFPYSELVRDGNAESRLLDYAKQVFDICSPTLLI